MTTQTFHNVLHVIQVSGLNFKMEISPFSATINLKNSALKDKHGNQISVKPDEVIISDDQTSVKNEKHARDINDLENANRMLQTHLENALSDCDKIYKCNNQLDNAVKTLHSKLTHSEQKCIELSDVAAIKDALEEENKKLKQDALDHASTNDTLNQVVGRLKNKLHDSDLKAKRELVETRKELKAEIKSWRKELGEERKAKIKLEEELEKTKVGDIKTPEDEPLAVSPKNSPLEISCIICSETIKDYLPVYFHDIEMNPACSN